MSRITRSRPRKNSSSLCCCAYCHFWEGDAQLKAHGANLVEFEKDAKGFCVCNGRHSPRNAGATACTRDFKLSNEASKYAV